MLSHKTITLDLYTTASGRSFYETRGADGAVLSPAGRVYTAEHAAVRDMLASAGIALECDPHAVVSLAGVAPRGWRSVDTSTED